MLSSVEGSCVDKRLCGQYLNTRSGNGGLRAVDQKAVPPTLHVGVTHEVATCWSHVACLSSVVVHHSVML